MNIPIFITHWTKLKRRKRELLERMKKEELDGRFIEKYDSQDLDLKSEWCLKFTNHLKSGEASKNGAVISLFLKHIECYRIMIEENIEVALILEDDVLFENDFKNKLNNYINQLPNDWNSLCIGNGCKLHINSDRFKELKPPNVYLKYRGKIEGEGIGLFRCTDSYFINLKTATQLYDIFIKINQNCIIHPIDLWLNEKSSLLGYKIYWCEPTIISQGSQNGSYLSSVNYKREQEKDVLKDESD